MTLVIVSVIVFVFEDQLARGIDPATADGSTWPQPTGNLPLLALRAPALPTPSVRSDSAAARPRAGINSSPGSRDRLRPGAAARENYVLFPSLYTDWVYSGDILRTCGRRASRSAPSAR